MRCWLDSVKTQAASQIGKPEAKAPEFVTDWL